MERIEFEKERDYIEKAAAQGKLQNLFPGTTAYFLSYPMTFTLKKLQIKHLQGSTQSLLQDERTTVRKRLVPYG